MIEIKQIKYSNRSYSGINKYLFKVLINNNVTLPKNLFITLTDGWQSTHIFEAEEEKICLITLNLIELLKLYKRKEYLNRGFNDKITFKQFLVFVLYHELAHYQKHFYNTNIEKDKTKKEAQADYYAMNLWREVYFDDKNIYSST